MLTAQEVFNSVLFHLRFQDGRSRLPALNLCAYRSENGKRCAVGLFIPNAEYGPHLEEMGVGGLLGVVEGPIKEFIAAHLSLLKKLQQVHDAWANWSGWAFNERGEAEMLEVAAEEGLLYVPPASTPRPWVHWMPEQRLE